MTVNVTPPTNSKTTATSSLLERLDGVRQSGAGWKARCPAHDDGVGAGDSLLERLLAVLEGFRPRSTDEGWRWAHGLDLPSAATSELVDERTFLSSVHGAAAVLGMAEPPIRLHVPVVLSDRLDAIEAELARRGGAEQSSRRSDPTAHARPRSGFGATSSDVAMSS